MCRDQVWFEVVLCCIAKAAWEFGDISVLFGFMYIFWFHARKAAQQNAKFHNVSVLFGELLPALHFLFFPIF